MDKILNDDVLAAFSKHAGLMSVFKRAPKAESEKLLGGMVPEGAQFEGKFTHKHPTSGVVTHGTFSNIEHLKKIEADKKKGGTGGRIAKGVLGAAGLTGLAFAGGAAAANAGSPYEVNP